MARKKLFITRMLLSLTQEQKAHVERRAQEEDVTYSDYLRWLIAADMKRQVRPDGRKRGFPHG